MSEFILNLAEYEAPKVVEDRQKDYVTFGVNNSYYRFLIERYKNSTTNNAVINAITHLIYGRGLSALDASKKPNEYAQLIMMLSKQDVRQVVSDFYMLGQCAIQVHYDAKHERILKALHIPVQLLAPEKCDKEGQINNYYYSDNWENLREFPPMPIPAFGKSKDKIEIFFIKPYSVGMKYFSYPMYQGGLPYATLEEEIAEYLINDVQNGFSGTKVVNIIGDYTEEQQRVRSRQIQEKLTGSKGQKVIVSFSGDKELKTEVMDIPLNDAPEHYQYLSTECTEKILLSHKVVSGLIFGVAKSSGFSSNAEELKNATILFDNMVIRPIQDVLIDAFDTLLAFNGISLKLYFKTLQPLEFIDLENAQTTEQVQEKTGTELSEQVDLSKFGEEVNPNWILIDEFEVDYNTDESENELLSKEPKKSFLQKLAVSTGMAFPNSKSEQDEEIDGIKFITRYVYAGEDKANSRSFCREMKRFNKIYRKEDIERMSVTYLGDAYRNSEGRLVGWGPRGALSFDRFLYKGGGNCHHRWNKQVYASFSGVGIDVNSPRAKQVAVRKAEKLGYVIKNPTLVSVRPIDMVNRGFLPKNN
jgi:calcineurin-like phosphoesterase family protein